MLVVTSDMFHPLCNVFIMAAGSVYVPGSAHCGVRRAHWRGFFNRRHVSGECKRVCMFHRVTAAMEDDDSDNGVYFLL